MAEARRLASLTDADLERALRRLGRRVEFPATPDLTSAVRARIAEQPAPRPERLIWFTPRRGLAAAAAILLLLLVGALAIFPGARDAVADLFGVRGIQITIERDEEPTPPLTLVPPTAAASPVGPDLSLGRQVTLDEARMLAPYEVHVPDAAMYGEPDEVYVRTLLDGNTMVSLIYYPTPDLPEAEETGVGALLMQFEAREDVNYIMKGVFEGGGHTTPTELGDGDAWWVTGATRIVLLDDPSAACCPAGRPSANVLLWEQDGLTLRLESDLTMSRAITLAESIESSAEEGS